MKQINHHFLYIKAEFEKTVLNEFQNENNICSMNVEGIII